MFLMSLANILPRLASTTAFLCLVVAHLEWPDIALPPNTSGENAADHLDEQAVHADVPGDLGVERRREQVALPHRNDPTRGRAGLDLREDLHLRRDLLDPGRADEDRPDRLAVDPLEGEVLLEALDLPPERVPADRHVDAAERLLPGNGVHDAVGQQDHSRARPVRRHPLLDPVEDRFAHVEGPGELVDRRRLPARDDEGVHLGQLGRPPDRACDDVAFGERGEVLADVALQGEHADDGVSMSGHVGPKPVRGRSASARRTTASAAAATTRATGTTPSAAFRDVASARAPTASGASSTANDVRATARPLASTDRPGASATATEIAIGKRLPSPIPSSTRPTSACAGAVEVHSTANPPPATASENASRDSGRC